MELQKLNVKIFTERPNSVALTNFIDVFHGWIQASDGVYHDVADYSHMQAGPGIVLVANDAHVSIGESGGRRGLVFSQKAPLAGSNQTKLRVVLRAAQGLVKDYNPAISENDDQIIAEFTQRFYDTQLFWDKYAGGKFAEYLFKAKEFVGAGKTTDADRAVQLLQEAQLFQCLRLLQPGFPECWKNLQELLAIGIQACMPVIPH